MSQAATEQVYDSANFKFCANARIRVAKVGAALPTGLGDNATFSSDWTELGYVDEKGIQVDDAKTMVDIKSLQSFYATLKLISERKHTLQFNLQEWTKNSVGLAFGGGTWTTQNGVSAYTPPDPSFLDNRALSVDWSVFGANWRWVIYKGIVSSNIQTTLAKSSEALLPITFEAMGASQMGGGKALPWQIFTDDPGFASTTTTAPATGTGTTGTGTTPTA